jgi:hypothetical protein
MTIPLAAVAGLVIGIALGAYCLRHSCGYALADKGIDLRTI